MSEAIEKVKGALRFYAKPSSWAHVDSAIEHDQGRKARAALEALEAATPAVIHIDPGPVDTEKLKESIRNAPPANVVPLEAPSVLGGDAPPSFRDCECFGWERICLPITNEHHPNCKHASEPAGMWERCAQRWKSKYEAAKAGAVPLEAETERGGPAPNILDTVIDAKLEQRPAKGPGSALWEENNEAIRELIGAPEQPPPGDLEEVAACLSGYAAGYAGDSPMARSFREQAAKLRAHRCGGDEAWHKANRDDLMEKRRKIDALREELAEAKTRNEFADKLFDRVVISGGAGQWTIGEMRDWCCDYKDHKNGYPAGFILKHGHARCTHTTAFSSDTAAREANDPRVIELERQLEAARQPSETAEALAKDLDARAIDVGRSDKYSPPEDFDGWAARIRALPGGGLTEAEYLSVVNQAESCASKGYDEDAAIFRALAARLGPKEGE